MHKIATYIYNYVHSFINYEHTWIYVCMYVGLASLISAANEQKLPQCLLTNKGQLDVFIH